VYRYCSRVSAAGDITASLTSQTNPVYPTVICNALQNIQGLLKRLVIAETDFKAFTVQLKFPNN